jgi:hypothetical protein
MGLATLACDRLRNGAGYVADLSQLIVAPSVFAMGLGISLLIGLAGSMIPASNASRGPIPEALRVND